MRRIAYVPRVLTREAFEDFGRWATESRPLHARIIRLIRDIQRDPFGGIGKPEPTGADLEIGAPRLKRDLAGLWSGRIADEYRLVYRVTHEGIVIVSCRFHYQVLTAQVAAEHDDRLNQLKGEAWEA